MRLPSSLNVSLCLCRLVLGPPPESRPRLGRRRPRAFAPPQRRRRTNSSASMRATLCQNSSCGVPFAMAWAAHPLAAGGRPSACRPAAGLLALAVALGRRLWPVPFAVVFAVALAALGVRAVLAIVRDPAPLPSPSTGGRNARLELLHPITL